MNVGEFNTLDEVAIIPVLGEEFAHAISAHVRPKPRPVSWVCDKEASIEVSTLISRSSESDVYESDLFVWAFKVLWSLGVVVIPNSKLFILGRVTCFVGADCARPIDEVNGLGNLGLFDECRVVGEEW